MIKFTIPGEPTAKGRPRMTKTGHAYTPQKTVIYENWVKTCFLTAKQQKIEGDVPLFADITAYFEIPKSASCKKQVAMLDGMIRPTKRPDSDNCIKAVMDSLNGLAYSDDKNVVHLVFNKFYAKEPRVEVEISEI